MLFLIDTCVITVPDKFTVRVCVWSFRVCKVIYTVSRTYHLVPGITLFACINHSSRVWQRQMHKLLKARMYN